MKKMLREAYEAGAHLYYELNFRASHIHEIPEIIGSIEENMRMSSVVRGSLEDFTCLYGTDDVEKIYEEHVKSHCPYFICTNGSKEIYLRTPSIEATFPVEQIEVKLALVAERKAVPGFDSVGLEGVFAFGIHEPHKVQQRLADFFLYHIV